MYQVTRTIISNDKQNAGLYQYSDSLARLAKNLKNAALFRIRQIYTGYNKDTRSPNEQEVFDEVALLEKKYSSIKVKRNISYKHLEKLMRVTNNPDFFAGLPMQTSQEILKQAVNDFKSWRKSVTEYNRHPEKFLGRPKMPGYCKSDVTTFTMTNQDFVIYADPVHDENDKIIDKTVYAKLPLTKERLLFPQISTKTIPSKFKTELTDVSVKEAKIIPFYGRYIISCTIETPDTDNTLSEEYPNTCAVDFGVGNFASIVSSDGSSRLYKGGAVLSDIQWFSKQRAGYVGIMTKGHDPRTVKKSSRRLTNLSYNRACFSEDQLHKISRSIINYCILHKAGRIVLGVNRLWKQGSNMGRYNNQNFVSMPIARLRDMITYKASAAGIVVIEQEESYTSKADISSMDTIPVYGTKKAETATFSGKRISRGLYQCADGTVINADCNGAANIMRKAIPDVWGNRKDWSFLSDPEVYGFHELNPSSNPVKRIAGQ